MEPGPAQGAEGELEQAKVVTGAIPARSEEKTLQTAQMES